MSKNLDKRPHHRGGFFTGDYDIDQSGALYTAVAILLSPLLIFLRKAPQYCLQSPNAFQLAEQPPKVPIPVADSRPHLIHASLGPTDSILQSASGLVQPL